MNRWILSAYLLALTTLPAGASDVRLDAYRNPPTEMFSIFNRLYLDGVKGGLMSYNAWLKSHGEPAAFCLPEKLAMTAEQAEEIMLRSADKRSAKGDMLIAPLFLWGLQDTFPCEKSGG